ncbi:hypothetical protein QJS04_geneDACA004968 [Acorus gramineus]|uniref:Uncharacterized protein n=2 Tax=Acorus TaxID=4464 RepID=A0AAV9E7U6_ACOCL|nr:hypothetical protein QJS04_geneDACA004968 [Acorus gramineus]KAK1309362.1 hypothetical protein QJS10_CPA09g00153 [Acorus calamus]
MGNGGDANASGNAESDGPDKKKRHSMAKSSPPRSPPDENRPVHKNHEDCLHKN